jgi:O-antigen biosynthesis protein
MPDTEMVSLQSINDTRSDAHDGVSLIKFNPLQHAVSTRVPDRDVLTAWTGHIPFGMSIVDMVRPRVLVELGTHWGASYCAFCQAVKELRLATQCYAVDTWQGDAHAAFYTEEVFENLKAHHDQRYSLFSKLIRSTFDDALHLFGDGTIDLLHIDGYHTYEAVRHDFQTWLPKVSGRGIVLFHDIEVRDRDTFGVWRFWDELKQRYPHFEFFHSYGLGVIAIGDCIPDGLLPLFNSPQSDQDLIRQYFRNLGDHLVELHAAATQQANMVELLEAKSEECARIEAARAAAAAELAAVQVHFGRFRYRAVDRAAKFANRVPFLSSIMRSVGLAVIKLIERFN